MMKELAERIVKMAICAYRIVPVLRLSSLLWLLIPSARAEAPNLAGNWATLNGAGQYTFVDDGKKIAIMGVPSRSNGFGWLQWTGVDRSLHGELTFGGCWYRLEVEPSEDALMLSVTSYISYKKSTRRCLSVLNKEARQEAKRTGEVSPNHFTLIRR
jgi:hypothetical protein